MADETQVRERMWKAMAQSPFVMVGIEGDGQHSEPLTAQLDPDANSEFWFYVGRDNRVAGGGRAMAQFVSKGHDVFACISGILTEETREEIKDKYWSKQVEAWFPEGRNDPQLMMLRFDLDSAEIWESDLGLSGRLKLMTGATIAPHEAGEHVEVAL
jgi:general stress protein 26